MPPVSRRAFSAGVAAALLPESAMSQSILDLAPPPAGLRIAYGADPNQFGELRLPTTKIARHPVVIFLHGGYWRKAYDLTHTGHFCVALNAAGYATWSVEYRRIGQPGGGYPGTFDDVRAAALHLKTIAAKHQLDLTRVVAAGHSAGGQLALWLAAQNTIPLRGVVGLAAVSDLREAWTLGLSDRVVGELLGGSPKDFEERYRKTSPLDLLPIATPQHLFHGTADDVVPFELSQRFAAASKNATLIPLQNAGHFELIDPRTKEFAAVLAGISSLTGATGPTAK